MVRVNNAEGARRSDVGIAPSEGCADGFGGVALALKLRSEHPTEFGHRQSGRIQQSERRVKFAFVVGVTELADEVARRYFLDGPVSETEPMPTAGVAEQASPYFFPIERPTTDKSRYEWIGPERTGGYKVLTTVRTQSKPRRAERRNFHGRGCRHLLRWSTSSRKKPGRRPGRSCLNPRRRAGRGGSWRWI
jgi:hypothetical protein